MTTEHAPAAGLLLLPQQKADPLPSAEPKASGGGRPTSIDEHTLYCEARDEWARLVSPNWITMLSRSDDARVLELWRIASKELKRAVWALASDELKSRIRTITTENPQQ